VRCIEIDAHFRGRGKWVDWARTTDTFKAGDPQRSVRIVAVAWKASWDALREAHARGADLFVSHESICVHAVNGSPGPEVTFALPSERKKFDWLAQSGLVVYRCHDYWDQYPEEGIRWAWQRGLALSGQVTVDAYPLLVTRTDPVPLRDLARHILKRVKPLGQNGVLVTGDLEQRVAKVATGTGVTTDPVRMVDLGADVGVLTDDYYAHVRMGTHARELGFPTITVNHGVSEEWGVQNLAAYLSRTFPELEVFHIPQRCPYLVMADRSGVGENTN
jgi:putative NIF3 family GTP cyclohydrolase 1 type 2